MENAEFHVLGEWSGRTIQEVLSIALSISKGNAKKLLDTRSVFINNKRVWMAKFKIKTGDHISVQSHIREKDFTGLDTKSVLFEDAHYIIVNKPADILSNGGNSCETLVQKKFGSKAIKAVHRLDKDTSGCLLFSRNVTAGDLMIAQFKARQVQKIYHVLCVGRYHGGKRSIQSPIDGKEARTTIQLIRQLGELCLVEAQIETGRTHQIRKHLLSIGLPVLGDRHYTSKRSESEQYRTIERQMLHAYQLAFKNPISKKEVKAIAPYPEDFKRHASGGGK